MKKYFGTKTVQATPCSLEEAVERLGRNITPTTGETEGYLIEYEDGYQSWSPKSTFYKAYRPAETFLDRLYIERSDLADKIEKLCNFMQTESFKDLAPNQQSDLKEQFEVMCNYLRILDRRITQN